MNHPDDLETTYKTASNEQPSSLTDQLILQAAEDAISKDNTADLRNKNEHY